MQHADIDYHTKPLNPMLEYYLPCNLHYVLDIPIFLRKCQPEIRISAISPIAIKLTNNRTSTDAGDTAARCVSQHMAAHLHTVYIEILISVGKVEIRVLFKIGGHLNDTLRSQ